MSERLVVYSEAVTRQEQSALEQRTGVSLVRYDPDYSWAVESRLAAIWQADKGLLRPLTAAESDFIRNERLLCAIDFHYWTRYARLLPDAALGVGDLITFSPWASQSLIFSECARLEELAYEQYLSHRPQDGILIAVPKARQEGISIAAAMLKMHRLTTSPYSLAVTASENLDKRTALYQRDERIHQHLPWWLQPSRTEPDIINERLTFGKLDSSVLYQDYAQKSSLAAGEQYLLGHMSELAQGDQIAVDRFMELDYFPAIPQSWRTLHILESTPAGQGGWWHPFVMANASGSGRWTIKFVPWYMLEFKYRRTPPADWQPNAHSLLHAEKVRETSPGYIGRVVELSKDQLYWWESTREEYRKKGSLSFFLTNYPATLEESFQTSGNSIFDFETIDYYRTRTRPPGGAYQIVEGAG
jgi:hypothetical protein